MKKDGHKIQNLSSGQRKRALIDIIHSLLISQNNISRKKIILAIDEPEASLHINNCFEQFEKLESISGNEIQTFVTTHWYGAIPAINNASIIHISEVIDNQPEVKIFNSKNVFDNHEANRIEDLEFKSIYDLASALLSLLRHGTKNILIVEGVSDKIYLECYLDIERTKIISIGGIDRMIELANFMSIPLSNKKENIELKNKIIFLSDNDLEYKKHNLSERTQLEFIRYIQINGNIELVDYDLPRHGAKINIEDTMSSTRMWLALNKIKTEFPDLFNALMGFEKENDFNISIFEGNHSFLKTALNGNNKVKAFEDLMSAIKPLKTRLAIEYRNLKNEEEMLLDWIVVLKEKLK